MMDYLDVLNGSGYQTYRGEYYSDIGAPTGIDQEPKVGGIPVPFFYEMAENLRSRTDVSRNMIDQRPDEVAIKTKSPVFFGKEFEGFAKLQNGFFYQVTAVQVDIKGISKQAALYVPVPVGADYLVRLTKIDNPFKVYEVGKELSTPYTMDEGGIAGYTITVAEIPEGLNEAENNPTIAYKGTASTTVRFIEDVGYNNHYSVTVEGASASNVFSNKTLTVTLTEYTDNITISVTTVEKYQVSITYSPEMISDFVTADEGNSEYAFADDTAENPTVLSFNSTGSVYGYESYKYVVEATGATAYVEMGEKTDEGLPFKVKIYNVTGDVSLTLTEQQI